MSKTATEYRLERRFQTRVYAFSGLILFSAVILILQLGNLQLVKGFENRILAKKFVSRQEFTIAPRGLMYDRNHQEGVPPLVQNINYIDFVIYPSRFADIQTAVAYVQEFCRLMGRPYAEFEPMLRPAAWKDLVRKNESITLLNRMTRREHERLDEFRMSAHYGAFITNHLRYYTMGPALAHVTGYIGLPSRGELDRKQALSYQMIGKGGLEARYDAELRGTDGIRMRHRIIDSEEQIAESEHGNNVVLTIDRDVQAAAYRALSASGKRGTAIAMNASTGEILAMVSLPTFDPNILSSGTSDQRTRHYNQVVEHEGFLNLAIAAKFPPGSTFKPLVALAALEQGGSNAINENQSFNCYGKWQLQSSMPGVPASEFYCWDHGGHGTNNLIGAIQKSCSVYFYQLGYRMGPTSIIDYARKFGLNKRTEVDLPGETEGFVPDQRWKQITWSNRWYDGDTVNMAIGQGFMETTPLEVAVMFGALANRGKMYRPHLVREVRDPLSNRVLRSNNQALLRENPVSTHSLDVVQAGMRAVVTNGTASFLNRRDMVAIAGKTGTVQTRSVRNGQNHAWFAGYAPYDGPIEDRVVVVVFVEFGMGGSAVAAPIAGEIFRAAFPNEVSTRPAIRTDSNPAESLPAASVSVPLEGDNRQ